MIDFGLGKIQEQAIKMPAVQSAAGTAELPRKASPPTAEAGAARSEAAGGPALDSKNLDALKKAVDDINSAVSAMTERVRYAVDPQSHQVTAQVVDATGDKVVREIPPKELLELRERLKEVNGLIFDQEA